MGPKVDTRANKSAQKEIKPEAHLKCVPKLFQPLPLGGFVLLHQIVLAVLQTISASTEAHITATQPHSKKSTCKRALWMSSSFLQRRGPFIM